MPTTTVPQFDVGGITAVFTALCAQIPEPPARGNAAAAGTDSAVPPARLAEPVALVAAAVARGQHRHAVPELRHSAASRRRSACTRPPRRRRATSSRASTSCIASRSASRIRAPTAATARTRWRVDYAKGWQADTYHGVARLSAFGAAGGKRAAFVRIPDKHATIIILTNDDSADAKSMADKITDRLIAPK